MIEFAPMFIFLRTSRFTLGLFRVFLQTEYCSRQFVGSGVFFTGWDIGD